MGTKRKLVAESGRFGIRTASELLDAASELRKQNERLITEREQLIDMLRMCHDDLDPGISFDEWIVRLQRINTKADDV